MTDTTPDYTELIERLEKVEPDTPGEGVTRYYRNPDGPEAAAALRTLLERNKELEKALEQVEQQLDYGQINMALHITRRVLEGGA